MWDEAFGDVQGATRLGESLDDLADLPLVECVGSLSALQTELFVSQFRSSLESFQDSIAEQMAQLQEEMAPLLSAAAFDAIDQSALVGGTLQIPNAVNTGLSDDSESLRRTIAGGLELVSTCELAKLRPADI